MSFHQLKRLFVDLSKTHKLPVSTVGAFVTAVASFIAVSSVTAVACIMQVYSTMSKRSAPIVTI
jgi:hypothetical protein